MLANKEALAAPSEAVKLVIVELDGRRYAFPIGQVLEILRMVTITPLPDAPEWIEGVVNLRGKVIPVIDLRKRFGLEARAHGLDTPLCVVRVFHRTMAVVPDAAVEVLDIGPDSLEVPDELAGSNHPISHVVRTDRGLVPVLILERICDGAQDVAMPDHDFNSN